MLFHHDDWGSYTSTFISVPMFEEFFVEPYKEIYGYYKSHGVDYIVHHSDSYAATLVPSMIEMGIDVFQGCMETNKVDELLAKYGDQISFMGCIENIICDKEDWTNESVEAYVRQVCDKYGYKSFIPCICQGGPGSVYKGVYGAITNTIDKINKEKFGIEHPEEGRVPIEIMF